MAGQMEDWIALVTDEASGIGRATAMAFARDGATAVLADINVDSGEETRRLIENETGDANFVEAAQRTMAARLQCLFRQLSINSLVIGVISGLRLIGKSSRRDDIGGKHG